MAPSQAGRCFEVNYARWWISLAVDDLPRLRGFIAASHENRIDRFRKLDREMQALAARLVRARITNAIPSPGQRTNDREYQVLARELVKRQRHLPVRELLGRMPGAMRSLAPGMMMSPLSVAQYLPANAPPFDLVIFDEASQIRTWDAIGRGRQVIVVGDPKQLPPTNFFERETGEEAPSGGEDDFYQEDLESVLDECRGCGISFVELTWHYRSRHESLIAFSNARYYGGRLAIFPSPSVRDTAVQFRLVPDGGYARGGARTNLVEARAVVAEVVARLEAMIAAGPCARRSASPAIASISAWSIQGPPGASWPASSVTGRPITAPPAPAIATGCARTCW